MGKNSPENLVAGGELLPPPESIRKGPPELVPIPHRQKPGDAGHCGDAQPENGGKQSRHLHSDQESRTGAEEEAASEPKPLFEGIAWGLGFHGQDGPQIRGRVHTAPDEPESFTLFLLRLAASPSGRVGLAFLTGQYVPIQPGSESLRPPCHTGFRSASRRTLMKYPS